MFPIEDDTDELYCDAGLNVTESKKTEEIRGQIARTKGASSPQVNIVPLGARRLTWFSEFEFLVNHFTCRA